MPDGEIIRQLSKEVLTRWWDARWVRAYREAYAGSGDGNEENAAVCCGRGNKRLKGIRNVGSQCAGDDGVIVGNGSHLVREAEIES